MAPLVQKFVGGGEEIICQTPFQAAIKLEKEEEFFNLSFTVSLRKNERE